MKQFFIPALAAAGVSDAPGVGHALYPFKGHRMAKAALEMAVLDAELRAEGRSFARELGSVHDVGAVRGLGRHHGLDSRSCSMRSAATSTPATCASS